MCLMPWDSDLLCGRDIPCRDCSDLKASAHPIAFVFSYLLIIPGVPEMAGEGELVSLAPTLAKGWGVFPEAYPRNPAQSHLFFGLISTEALRGGSSLSITQVWPLPAVPASRYPSLPRSFFEPHHLPRCPSSLSLPSGVKASVAAHFLPDMAWYPDSGLSLTSLCTQSLHVQSLASTFTAKHGPGIYALSDAGRTEVA